MTGTALSNPPKKSIWAQPENTELLIRLWDEGLSAAQISGQIPGSTRNGVIGRAHRMGLSGRKRQPSASPVRIRVRKERQMPVFKPVPLPPAPPNGEGIPFMKANATTCRSVEGYRADERGHNMAIFCSNLKDVEASFCPYHQGLYYRRDAR